ncbi:LOW QUALITY PROTEIN: centromere protein F [Phyllostomus hastatus]|uniref:LOW QUALITY PROTEIN: centromere protein F n=1 Tax=Phyllostomus hastatus TaxID=9423 RepID=UPI001E680035|nr:LOW QUALITY PROTEIN: centromere protein F [Phyllostomus hastatus]
MSWVVEEWKEGLPTRALQKIQELEGQLDKLKKERQQRQFQLETLEAVLQKQKQKVENEKTEATTLKNENRSLTEICENLDKAKQKISHELQVKEAQVNLQEGQLSSTKKQIEKLEQELKSCKSELERSQKAVRPANVSGSACDTPQKLFTTPITPSQYYSGSKYEDGKEKYDKEVEERKRYEAEVKALQAKKASQVVPQNTMNHRDIARHQASSSVFPWQQEQTPSRLSSNALQTPIRRGFSASRFSREQEATPSSRSALPVGQRGADSSFCDNASSSQLLDQLKTQNQELRSKIGELELQLQGQEKEMKVQVNQCQELRLQLEKAKTELNEKEKVWNKSRAELTAQYDQASAKSTALEQKLKKLTEDLSCQRQNAESSRCSLEQKLKEKEKEFQEELSSQQRAFQILYRESSQVKGRLTQELQQAKNARNSLQAELDKVTSGKHQLERELDELKQHFSRSQQAFRASQTAESELRRSSEEMKKENSFLKSQSEQSAREVCHLQEELKKTKQCLSQSQDFAEEMRAKNAFQETTLRDLQEKINQQENSLTSEKLKLALADLEKQRDCSQDLLKKRECHIEQLSKKLSKTERESEALLSALELKKKEYEELNEEKTLFSHWKSEKEQLIKQMKSENEILQSKVNQLETCLKTQETRSNEYSERVSALEVERESLSAEVRDLCRVIENKTVEVETQKEAQVELQQKAELSDQKHKRETESMCLKVSELSEQVEDLKQKLQLLSSEITDKDQRYQDLQSEHERLRELLTPSDSLLTDEGHHRSLLASEQQSEALQGRSDSCDTSGSEESALESKDRTPKQDLHLICDKDVQQDLSPEMEKVTKTAAVMLAGEGSQEQPPETSSDSLVEDKAQDLAGCISELSLSGPNALVPMDFLETQVTIQNLQLQVKETSNESLRLPHAIEECDKNVEILLSETEESDSKLNVQEVQLATKIETCRELGKTVEELKKETPDLMEKLESFSCDNPEFHQGGESSAGLNASSEMGTAELSAEVTADNVAEVNDNWRERFLGVESELERIKSEQGSIEHRAHSVEADLARVQTEKLLLEKDNENKQGVISCLEEKLSVVTRERNQLHGELDTLSKENKELRLTSEKVEEKIRELEFHQGECLSHIDVVEAEVKEKTQLLQTLSSDLSQLVKEKAHLQEQLQSLEKDSQALSLGKNELEDQMGRLKNEKESLVRESESLQNTLRELEQEKLAVTKALEAARTEKGEVAVRLSSTQDEVHQLRKGMETLRVRIEADEKKQLHILEKLKESESKNHSLQDKVENLESELQMAEENQEMVILDAEHSKAEVETLKTQVEAMTEHLNTLELDLVTIRSEKENLTRQLQEKQGQVSELDASLSSLKNMLEEKEQEKMLMQEESKAAEETLGRELEELTKEVAALCEDSDARKVLEQSSPVQRVQQLSESVRKLRDQLEENDKKQIELLGKLQETKHQADMLKGEVDQLEEELKKSRKTHEHVTQEAEDSKAEVEKLRAKIEEMAQRVRDLEADLGNLRSEKENLTKELQKEQGRVSELEILKSSFENQLQERQQEIVRLKEESRIVEERLQTQLTDLQEKLSLLCDDQGTWKAREQDLSGQITNLELEKSQLLQGLDQARSDCITLQSSVNGLIQEVEDGKQKLEKRDQEISLLKHQIQDQEQLVSKLSWLEEESQVMKKEKAELESLTVELEQKIQRLQSRNDTLQDTHKVLQNSYRDLQEELESMKMEQHSYVERVNSLTSRETELQGKVHEITQKMTDLTEEFNGEKHRLTEELNVMLEEMKPKEGQLKELMLENSDLKRRLDYAHKDQMEKQEQMREEIAEYQRQLQEAEKRHQTLLLDTNKQHEMEIQTYREKLTSTEECVSSQKVEIDLLKSSKEQLSNSLKENTELLGELIKTKMDNQTHIKEKTCAQGKMDILLRHHKPMEEEEKEQLQKELCQLEEAAPEKQKPGALVDARVDELMTELKELKETLEGKSKEAEEYLDKYCSLLISHEKLERDKEMLETQVARLSSQQSPPTVQTPPLLKSVDPESPPVPCVTERKGSSGGRKASGKRQRSSGIRENEGGAAPSPPHTFPKRSQKAARRGTPPAEDAEDTEFEPEGLPEVVQKGLADIPTGKMSPFILRRTTMATRTSPRLAAQKLTQSLLNIHKENHAGASQPRAAGSRSQKVKVTQQSPSDSGTILQDPSARPLSASNIPKRQWASSPSEGLKSKRGCPAPSSEAGTESQENCRIQ